MALVVQKFGGTSMGSAERIRNVAQKVLRERERSGDVAVVVSAMAGETDRLARLFAEVAGEEATLNPICMQEYDAVVSTGEQVSAGLLAGLLNAMGVKARSFAGWQIGVLTDSAFGKAKIEHIATNALKEFLTEGGVPIITGFQGFNTEKKRQTTLGRGGSDTSAVAIAAALGAERCDIYTDVEGIYSTDPRLVPGAKKLDIASFEEVIEMASSGAKVLEPRSVLLSMKYDVNLQVLSSFNSASGSLVVGDSRVCEAQQVSSIASSAKDVQILLEGMPDSAHALERIFGVLAESNIAVDIIVKSEGADGFCNLSFTVNISDVALLRKILLERKPNLEFKELKMREDIVKISVIGMGMKTAGGILHKVLEIMAGNNVKIYAILTSEIKISLLIDAGDHKAVLDSLHSEFFGSI